MVLQVRFRTTPSFLRRETRRAQERMNLLKLPPHHPLDGDSSATSFFTSTGALPPHHPLDGDSSATSFFTSTGALLPPSPGPSTACGFALAPCPPQLDALSRRRFLDADTPSSLFPSSSMAALSADLEDRHKDVMARTGATAPLRPVFSRPLTDLLLPPSAASSCAPFTAERERDRLLPLCFVETGSVCSTHSPSVDDHFLATLALRDLRSLACTWSSSSLCSSHTCERDQETHREEDARQIRGSDIVTNIAPT